MKNYKKALLALSILATMPLFADSTNKRIEVTTFADEDGENPMRVHYVKQLKWQLHVNQTMDALFLA